MRNPVSCWCCNSASKYEGENELVTSTDCRPGPCSFDHLCFLNYYFWTLLRALDLQCLLLSDRQHLWHFAAFISRLFSLEKNCNCALSVVSTSLLPCHWAASPRLSSCNRFRLTSLCSGGCVWLGTVAALHKCGRTVGDALSTKWSRCVLLVWLCTLGWSLASLRWSSISCCICL